MGINRTQSSLGTLYDTHSFAIFVVFTWSLLHEYHYRLKDNFLQYTKRIPELNAFGRLTYRSYRHTK